MNIIAKHIGADVIASARTDTAVGINLVTTSGVESTIGGGCTFIPSQHILIHSLQSIINLRDLCDEVIKAHTKA